VSGSVTAGTLATAQAWAVAQRALLTGDALGGSYPKQEEWETDYEFVPRIDGIPTGDTANVRLYRVKFCRRIRSRLNSDFSIASELSRQYTSVAT